MDTNKLKKFAVDARNKIRHGVEAKLSMLGFDSKGNVSAAMKPQLMQGGSLWNGQLMTESFYHQWMALYEAVKSHGVHHVYEEAAYTWFNRLVAIRILQKNGIIEPVLSYTDEARTPKIVDDARSAGRMPPMPEADRQRLMELLDDDTKVTEQFAILITAYCHDNPVIRQSFGRMADYTELLLPNNILAEGGFIDDLNHTEFITDDDYKSSELIGWLYQFYISERKDEVFAKKGKYDADEIAPATQIFTPHWIVEYMVQNTIGRIYLDNHTDEADTFKPKWKYLVDQEQRDDDHIYRFNELTDLRLADLGCGSGHILGYMFDLLFDLYIYEGYTRKEAVENILRYNITGVDIDLRAKQLATFALLLKACQKDESFKDGEVLPNVLTMPEPIPESDRHQLFHEFFKGEETNNILAELDDAFDLLKGAQTLGSIMKFDLSKSTLLAIRQTMDYWKDKPILPDSVTRLLPSFRIILALTQKYTALVMNPPYLYNSKMNTILADYVRTYYEGGKTDLFAAFMHVAIERLQHNGKYGMLNMQSWMFLGSFKDLRCSIIENYQIESMLHLGPHTFDELSGEVVQCVAFIITKNSSAYHSIIYNLTSGNSTEQKEQLSRKIKPYLINQKELLKIPGAPIGYWISSNALSDFEMFNSLNSYARVRAGMFTGDNGRFVRSWWEIDGSQTLFNCQSEEEAGLSEKKWFSYNKGGGYRKWYGFNSNVVDYENNGYRIFKLAKKEKRNCTNYDVKYKFKDGITWNGIGSTLTSYRYIPKGFLFDSNKGPMIFKESDSYETMYSIGFLNTKVSNYFTKILNPTLSTQVTDVLNIPICTPNEGGNYEATKILAIDSICISKLDWDSHETSWDFKENPLVTIMKETEERGTTLEKCVETFEEQWTDRFMQLHANEEELNRQFIDIYGLQDELTPDVPLDEITILQQGEISISKDDDEQ